MAMPTRIDLSRHTPQSDTDPNSADIDLIGLLTLVAVAAFIFLSFEAGDPRRWFALALVLIFGSVLYFLPLGRGCHVTGSLTLEPTAAVHPPDPTSLPLWSRCWAAHVRLALLVLTASVLASLEINPIATIVLFFVVSAAAPELLPRRQGLIWPVLCGVATVVILGIAVGDAGYALYVGLGTTGGYLFVSSAAESRMRAGAANQESRRLLAELTEAHRQLQTYATQVETLAVAEERNRLSREMHDTLGHRLTVAAVQLEGAQRLISSDAERARSMVATVRQEIVDGLQELRQTVARLRTPLEADLRLPHALAKLGDGFTAATGIAVHLNVAPDLPELPPDHRQALFRAAQEALTNTQRHSGAGNVWISARPCVDDPNYVGLRVEDDGRGILDQSLLRGHGLRGMRERAEQLHGSIRLEHRSHRGGAAVEMRLPLAVEGPTAPAHAGSVVAHEAGITS